jgi:hypothetical protein
MTGRQAAQRIRKALITRYRLDEAEAKGILIWGEEEMARFGWGSGATAQVVWEEGPYEWAMDASGGEDATTRAVLDNLAGIHAEPYNGFILSLYKS